MARQPPSDAENTSEFDRFHNQTPPSPDAVMEALRELKAAMAAIEGRLAALEAGESSSIGLTRRLGLDVVEMGDALSRRLRALEHQTPPPAVAAPPVAEPVIEPAEAPTETALFISRAPPARRGNRLIALSVGMLLALILVLAGAWALQFYNVRSIIPGTAARGVANVPDAGAVTIAPAAASNAAPVTASPLPAARPAPHRQPTATDADAEGEPIGHVLYNAATPPPPKP